MTRDETICSFVPLVSRVARRVSIHIADGELDDLVGYGCAEWFGPSMRSTPIAACRLAHTSRAGCSGRDPHGDRALRPRAVLARTEVREAERERLQVAQQLGHVPTDAEMEARRPRFRQARTLHHQFSAARLDDPEFCEIASPFEDPMSRLISAQQSDEARNALASLPRKERRGTGSALLCRAVAEGDRSAHGDQQPARRPTSDPRP